MITVKFRSPFLLALLAIVFWSCKNKPDAIHITAPIFEEYAAKATDTSKPPPIRLEFSTKAYDYARQKKDSELILKAYNLKSDLLAKHFPDSVSAFLDNYLKVSSAKNDIPNLANGYYKKGSEYYYRNMADSSFRYFSASKQKYEQLNDSLQIAEKLIWMGNFYWTYNDFIELESTGTEILGLLGEKLDPGVDTAYAAIAYNFYGLAYTGRNEYENALEAYGNALRLAKDSISINTIQNNRAWVLMESNNYGEAIPILKKLINSEALKNDSATYAKALDNLGYSLFKTRDQDGLAYLDQSLAIRLEANDRFGQVPSYLHLSEYYRKSNPTRSKQYAEKAYNIATSLNSPNDRLTALKSLREISSGRELQYYSDLHIKINDSIGQVRQSAKNQFAKIRYDSKREKEDNLRLKSEQANAGLIIEKQRSRNLVLVIAILTICAGVLFIVFYFLSRIKLHKLNSVYETEIRISDKLHDEFANDTYSLMTFADHHDLSDEINKETLLERLENLYIGIRNISHENGAVATDANFVSELKEMISGYSNSKTRVLFKGFDNLPWAEFDKHTKITIYRIILELLVNMKKHSQCSLAMLEFSKHGNSGNIDYHDDGKGISDDVPAKKRLRNVETRIAAIKGTVTFDETTKEGFRVRFSFPI